ncbi:MAG: hypothetical protein HY673_10785 [Chloroflexi bacterium]|nr:hypothetical protein [Chloroflexota bacterium]
MGLAVSGCGTVKLTSSVEPGAGGSVSPASGMYDRGVTVRVTAAPSPGHRFERWEGSASGESPLLQLLMDGNKHVVARFIPTFSLSASSAPPNGGTVNPSSGTYDVGKTATVTLVATPAAGYRFSGWGGDNISGLENPRTFPFDKDTRVFASFVRVYSPPNEGGARRGREG